MSEQSLSPDQKGTASLTFGRVIPQTRRNYPDQNYWPEEYFSSEFYHLYGLSDQKHRVRQSKQFWVTADGIGTKPELAERMYTETGDPLFFSTLPTDAHAMVDGDEARFGRFMLGVAQIVDMNVANEDVITALAEGSRRSCDKGEFALLNGETAELGYRMSGYGSVRANIGAFGMSVIVPDKLILGEDLAPGQIIVGLQEGALRSNGFTKGRAIPEAVYLHRRNFKSKDDYVLQSIHDRFYNHKFARVPQHTDKIFLDNLMGHDFIEQVLVPWHQDFPELTQAMLTPSTLYGKFMYDAQNGIDGKPEIDIVAAAHITGGGVPEKIRRMVQHKGLGAHLEPVFPDPKAVTMLLELANTLPEEQAESIINDRTACEQWNRGIGFVIVVKTREDAKKLFSLSQRFDTPALQVGEIIEGRKIEWRGHTWNY